MIPRQMSIALDSNGKPRAARGSLARPLKSAAVNAFPDIGRVMVGSGLRDLLD